MSEVVLTVPCYNEEERLSPEGFARLLEDSRVGLLFVDDGSTDGTLELLEEIRARAPGRVDLLALEENQGKSEAVRRGLLRGLEGPAAAVGFTDADLSTPAEEVLRLVEVLCRGSAAAVIGARIAGEGDIQRPPLRRGLGRVFSSLGALVLRERIRDTQCGAKLFRRSPALGEALSQRFRSRWAFDVELLGRLKASRDGDSLAIEEVPLRRWQEVPGSKLGAGAMARAGLDLFGVALDLQRWKRERR